MTDKSKTPKQPTAIQYMLLPMEIGFQIGEATFLVKNHQQMKKMMIIKKVRQMEALVNYPDLGMCITNFEIYNDELVMRGRTVVK